MANRLTNAVRQALDRDASRPAIEYDGHWYDWGDLRTLAMHVQSLLRKTGADPSLPIAFIPRNRPSAVAALLGLIADERTISMVYPFQSSAAIAANLDRLNPAVVVAGPDLIQGEVAQFLAARAIPAIEIDEMVAKPIGETTVPSRANDQLQNDNPEIRILTSGTTGPPKQLPFAYTFFADHHIGPKLQAGGEDYWRDQAPFLLTFPISNITGMFTFLPTLVSGQRGILVDRFTLDSWREWVRRFKPVNAGLPPAGIQMLLDADVPVEELASVEYVGTGAAPLDPEVQRRFEERYNIPILLSYGATEFGGPVTAMTPEIIAQWGNKKLGSVGRPMPGVQLRVIDPESGKILGAGEEGLLEVVAPRIGTHWIRTSDIALIDADSFLYHRGRADGAVMRGGFKLVPEIIERALMLRPDITDVAVVGRKDGRLGEVPVAAVVMSAGAKWPGAENLDAYVRQHIPSTHVPVDWKQFDALPRNQSMKLDRPALKQLMA